MTNAYLVGVIKMSREELLMWLWVIFIIEGDVRSSVPFGWIRRKAEWKARKISFRKILSEVILELKVEHSKWRKALERGEKRDFVAWLAHVGYNANPSEAPQWEKNARSVLKWLKSVL